MSLVLLSQADISLINKMLSDQSYGRKKFKNKVGINNEQLVKIQYHSRINKKYLANLKMTLDAYQRHIHFTRLRNYIKFINETNKLQNNLLNHVQNMVRERGV